MAGEPDYEAALGLVKHLTTEELRDLVNQEDKLTDLLKDLPQIRNLKSEQEMLLVANKSLAEYNLTFEPKLNQGKQELMTKYEEAAKLSETVKQVKSELDNSSGQHSSDAIQALLQTGSQEMEEESDNLVQSCLNKEITLEEFLPEFLAKRKTAHLRRIKAEKISDIISHPSDGSSTAINTPYPVPPSVPGSNTPWSAPYPAQLSNMPMPF